MKSALKINILFENGKRKVFEILEHLRYCVSDQRNLGMSMRVERSSLDQVKKRFEMNKRKLEEKKKDYDFEERMKELKEEVSIIGLDKQIF